MPSLRQALALGTLVRLFFYALAGMVVLASAAVAQQSPQPEKAQANPPTEKKEVAVAAQIELLETKVRFETNGDSRKEVHTIVHINDDLGARQFGRISFDYNRSFQQIEFPLLRITHAGGGTADILPSAVTDQPNPAVANAPAYQDVRRKSVRLLGLAAGDTLEYRVVTNTTKHPLAPDFWLDHTFDRSGALAQENFELDLPGHANSMTSMRSSRAGHAMALYVGVPYTSYNYDEAANRSVYRWEVPSSRKLGPDAEDPFAPDVVISTFPTWFEVVNRFASTYLDWSEADWKETQAKARSLGPRSADATKLLRAQYEFVSQKLATLDLPLGASGYRLRHTKEIFDSGYATAEEKCLVLEQLARASGLHAEVVFTAKTDVQKQFGRPSVFDHVFVVISQGGKKSVLDPSLEVAPLGLISSQFRGKPALSLTSADGGDSQSDKWLTLPLDLPFAASQKVSIEAALTGEGTLDARVHYTMRGDNELALRLAFHQSERQKWPEVAQLLALADGFRGKITHVTASDPYAINQPFNVEYQISQPKFVDWTKTPVRIPALLPQVGLPDASAKRAAGSDTTEAIDLGTPLQIQIRASVQLPQGTTAQTPPGTAVVRDYAKFNSKYAADGSTITAERHLDFLERSIPSERAADYNTFVRAVQSDEAQEFILQRSNSQTASKSAEPTARLSK